MNQGNATTWGTWGNSAAVDRLRLGVQQGPRHAYLLSGPHDVGKSHIALRFAAALLCPSPPEPGEYCGECRTCRRVLRGVHPDVSRFDLAWQASQDDSSSKNLTFTIKSVREIGRHVALRPAEGNWRVVVVDDVETMQEPAQEAFLKTLEEPPSYVVILMLVTDAEVLLPTILSRCTVIPMVPATDAIVASALVEAGASEAEAERIAIATRGRVGLALRAMQDEKLLDALAEDVDEATRWIGSDTYGRMVAGYTLAEGFTANRERVFDRLAAAQAAWRELMLDASGLASATRHPVLDKGSVATVDDGVRALRAIDRCIRDLEANVRPRLAMATMVEAWPEVTSR